MDSAGSKSILITHEKTILIGQKDKNPIAAGNDMCSYVVSPDIGMLYNSTLSMTY